MKKKKILSIDFDYFQKLCTETLHIYPDGIDLPTEVSNVVWATKYMYEKDKLNKVTINKKELSLLYGILGSQNKNIPVLISNTHKDIYGFIHSLAKTDEELLISHIDMHHDFYNGNDKVDCGNWLGFIKKEYYKCYIQWITNELSLDVYGFTEKEKEKIPITIEKLSIKDYDAVFLCRSDNWFPPHLDSEFIKLSKYLRNNFDNSEYTDEGLFRKREI